MSRFPCPANRSWWTFRFFCLFNRPSVPCQFYLWFAFFKKMTSQLNETLAHYYYMMRSPHWQKFIGLRCTHNFTLGKTRKFINLCHAGHYCCKHTFSFYSSIKLGSSHMSTLQIIDHFVCKYSKHKHLYSVSMKFYDKVNRMKSPLQTVGNVDKLEAVLTIYPLVGSSTSELGHLSICAKRDMANGGQGLQVMPTLCQPCVVTSVITMYFSLRTFREKHCFSM